MAIKNSETKEISAFEIHSKGVKISPIKGRYRNTTWHENHDGQTLIEEATLKTELDTTSKDLDSSFHMSS